MAGSITSARMSRISGNAIRKAIVDFRRANLRTVICLPMAGARIPRTAASAINVSPFCSVAARSLAQPPRSVPCHSFRSGLSRDMNVEWRRLPRSELAPPPPRLPTRLLCPHETFKLRGRPIDGLLDRLAALRALVDHLGHRRLRIDLVGDLRRCRSGGERDDRIAARRVVVDCPLRRLDIKPRLEIEAVRIGGNIVPVARRNHRLDRGALRKMRKEALRRRLV